MFKDCTGTTEINAETRGRKDAGKIENILATQVIDAAIEVHRILGGPGQAQIQIPVVYKGCTLRNPMRLDLLVDDKVIIEVKATEQEQAVHRAQVLTYLRLTGLKLGLLLNFGQKLLRNGIERVVNDL